MWIAERDDGMYYVTAAVGIVPDEENLFTSIDEIEAVLDDELELLQPEDQNDH